MSIINDIRTIVKSDETKKKLDKLSTEKTVEEKDSINAYRAASYINGNGSTITGTDGNGGSQTVVDNGGSSNSVSPSYGSTNGYGSASSNSSVSYNDTGLDTFSDFNWNTDNSGFSNSSTNMSSSLSNLATQSSILPYAQNMPDEADLQSILTYIDGLTDYSADERQRLKDEYTRRYASGNFGIGSGTFSGIDIADSKSYVPKPGDRSNADSSQTDTSSIPKISAIVGFDADGETDANGDVKAVYVNIDKYPSYIPSIQFPQPTGWDYADDAPPLASYTSGKVWVYAFGATTLFSSSFEGLLNEIDTYFGQSYTYYGTNSYIGATSLVDNIPATYGNDGLLFTTNAGGSIGQQFSAIGGTAVDILGVVSTVSSGEIGQVPCGTYAGDTLACSGAIPVESSWPTEGAYFLTYGEGEYVGNSYDTLLPLKWQQSNSKVTVALGDGVNVIDTRTMTIEPTYDSGTMLSTYLSNGDFVNSLLLDRNGVPQERTTTEAVANSWKPLGAD